MAAAKLDIDIPVSFIVAHASELFQRVYRPGMPYEPTTDDDGFIACVKYAGENEVQSMEGKIEIDLEHEANVFRNIYRGANNMSPDTEPAKGEMKAWKATARFVILAVQADNEGDASAVFEQILKREQESADVSIGK